MLWREKIERDFARLLFVQSSIGFASRDVLLVGFVLFVAFIDVLWGYIYKYILYVGVLSLVDYIVGANP